MSQENLPLPVSGGGSGSENKILAQFYRISPSSINNINIPLVNSTTREFLPVGSYNNVNGPDGVTFPDLNSVQTATAGIYLHTITIYMSSDVAGIIAVDLVDSTNTAYNSAAFAIQNSSPASNAPIIMQAVLEHEPGDIIKIRFGGASPGDLGIVPSIWSIHWSMKS